METGNREWKDLQAIGYVRIGGSEEEKKTADYISEKVKETGINAWQESFTVNTQTIHKQMLIVDGKEYEVSAYGNCASTEKEGLTAPFFCMENRDDVNRKKAKGKIVMINGYLGYDLYKDLIECGAVGFISYSGEVRESKEQTDLDQRELREQLKKLGQLPGVHMKVQDAIEIMRNNPEMATLIIEQEVGTTNSQNVIAEIEGSEEKEEVIVLTAHYDSVPFSSGVYDNGAGSVILLELLRYYSQHQPKRTLRFIWTGCEERGLLGSKAYVAAHKEELKSILLCINVDVAGPVLGFDSAFVTADMSLVHMIEYLSKEVGYSIKVEQDIYSSDNIPFSDNGIPAVSFTRFGFSNTAYIHCRHDHLQFMSAESLEKTTNFVLTFMNRLLPSYVFPIPRIMPDNMVEKVNKYLRKDSEKKKQ